MENRKKSFVMLLIILISLFVSCKEGRNIQEIIFPDEFRGTYSGTYDLYDGLTGTATMQITSNNFIIEITELNYYYDFQDQIASISEMLEELHSENINQTFTITSVNMQGAKSILTFTLSGNTLTYTEKIGINGSYQITAKATLTKK